eukprot:m51a1_g6506 putative dual specificity protein phosphatase 1 isoform 2 (447) ;mRNA; f:233102-235157
MDLSYAVFRPDSATHITCTELYNAFASQAASVLDLRRECAFSAGHMPHSVNVPVEQALAQRPSLLASAVVDRTDFVDVWVVAVVCPPENIDGAKRVRAALAAALRRRRHRVYACLLSFSLEDWRERYPMLWVKGSEQCSLPEDDAPSEILDGFLYVGGIGSREWAVPLGVTHVVCAAAEYAQLVDEASRSCKCLTLAIDDEDDYDIAQHFGTFLEFAESAKRDAGKLLVHCMAGASRSVTLALLVVMQHLGVGVDQALKYMQSRRPEAGPNCGFIRKVDVLGLKELFDARKVYLAPHTLLNHTPDGLSRLRFDAGAVVSIAIDPLVASSPPPDTDAEVDCSKEVSAVVFAPFDHLPSPEEAESLLSTPLAERVWMARRRAEQYPEVASATGRRASCFETVLVELIDGTQFDFNCSENALIASYDRIVRAPFNIALGCCRSQFAGMN